MKETEGLTQQMLCKYSKEGKEDNESVFFFLEMQKCINLTLMNNFSILFF